MEPANSPENQPITVAGYSARYAAASRDLLQVEGGHVNDPVDRGGETKFGISLRFLASEGAFDDDRDGKADFDLDLDGDIDGADVRALTKGDAVYLFHRCFWAPLRADLFPAPIGEMLFDQAVNGGLSAARKLLQRAINSCLLQIPAARKGMALLKVDGQIGPASQSCLRQVLEWPSLGIPALVAAYRDAVRERYRAIVRRFPSQQKFLRGWLARAEALGR